MNTASLMQAALDCANRGWAVFPCKPRSKAPATSDGFKSATTDEKTIRDWWTRMPEANVGIACGLSNLTVLDCDHGLASLDDFREFADARGMPETFTVRTGRRPEFGIQMYFEGGRQSATWEADGVSGDVKSAGGYVLAPGSVHPDSGERYEILKDVRPAPLPGFVRDIRKREAAPSSDFQLIEKDRNTTLTRLAGKFRAAGMSHAELEGAMQIANATRCPDPLPEDELLRIVRNAMTWTVTPDVPVTIGKGASPGAVDADPVDWRTRYHTLAELEATSPAVFMVDGILHWNSIVALAGYAGDRKSIVALNLAAACVTGRPFMGRFAVPNPPKRVIYLCPEMGLRELAERVRGLGMADYVGKTLFFRTLDKQGKMRLPDLSSEELDGALVILDTAIRFLEGSENDPQDMAVFAEQLFRLRSGGATVWVLFHSGKASAGQDLTLQNAVRGSSELAAMLSACWATRLIDPQDRFGSNSRLFPLKTREFECFPFEFSVERATAACTIVGEPAPEAVLRNRKDDAAREALRQIVEAEPGLGINRLRERLKASGHGRGQKWVVEKLTGIRGTGVVPGSSSTG